MKGWKRERNREKYGKDSKRKQGRGPAIEEKRDRDLDRWRKKQEEQIQHDTMGQEVRESDR